MSKSIQWGPTGKIVYERTYSRDKADGGKETWEDTVERVVNGNMALVPPAKSDEIEREALKSYVLDFKAIPAGRHLWMTGVEGRQFLFNCHVSAWNERVTDHFDFTFMRLMEGGGVGSNYSNYYLEKYPAVRSNTKVHFIADAEHADIDALTAVEVSEKSSESLNGDFTYFDIGDTREGWSEALCYLIAAHYSASPEYIVFDVSYIRPEGSPLVSSGGVASGPVPLVKMLRSVNEVLNAAVGQKLTGMDAMHIDHAIAKCVVAGGNRRSARMSIMHYEDPQIFEFMACKQSDIEGEHPFWTTNISVEIDDAFWDALVWDERTFYVFRDIVKGMYKNGEPGFWNKEFSMRGEVGDIVATNPCGEVPLEAWENCNLGHINLAAFVREDGTLDYRGLEDAHRLMTRMLMRATFGDVQDEKQRAKLAMNRRIGVGHLGYASMVALMGVKYSESPGNMEIREMLRYMANVVDDEAREYAHELRIPVPIKTRVVAPTGTIAKMPGVSEGIHPIMMKHFIRRVRFSSLDANEANTCLELQAQGYHVEPDEYADNTMVVSIPTKDILMEQVSERYGEKFAALTVQDYGDVNMEDMLNVQAMYQDLWADNAVSYTVNFDPGEYTEDDIANALLYVGPELKGATMCPEKSYVQPPYERITREEYEAFTNGSVGDSVDEECASGACPIK